MDHLIQNCRIKNKTCKYWHSPMNHGLGMAVVISYNYYKELAEGNVNPAYKIEKPLDFFTFRETLARQMLAYNPKYGNYLGDDKLRDFTKYSKVRR